MAASLRLLFCTALGLVYSTVWRLLCVLRGLYSVLCRGWVVGGGVPGGAYGSWLCVPYSMLYVLHSRVCTVYCMLSPGLYLVLYVLFWFCRV